MKPNFFLIGASRCGTTAVARHLSQHPDVFISNPKEPSFFMYAGGNPYGWPRNGHISDREQYLSLFRNSARKVRGDASTCYIYGSHCAHAIHEFEPQAKILAILRHPVERAYSMYLFWHQANPNKPHTSLREFRRAFLSDAYLTKKDELCALKAKDTRWLQDMGYYGRQLQTYYQSFPRDHICVIRYDDLVGSPTACLLQVYRFLEVDHNAIGGNLGWENETIMPTWRRLHNWLNLNQSSTVRQICKNLEASSPIKLDRLRRRINHLNSSGRSVARIPSELRDELTEVFRDDIYLLSELTGQDFTNWLLR